MDSAYGEEKLASVFASICPHKRRPTEPGLAAYSPNMTYIGEYLDTSLLKPRFKDFNCPPGPFLLPVKDFSQRDSRLWQIRRSPEYFLWRISNNRLANASASITDRSGMPLAANVMRMTQGADTIIWVFLKSQLKPLKRYYLYFEANQKGQIKKWIQPLITKG